MTYQVGDKIVHPLHGAGAVCEIVSDRADGQERRYYVMLSPRGDMRIMIPVDGCEQIGIRPVLPREQAGSVLEAIPELGLSEAGSWNRRYRENMIQIRSGDLMKVAAVIKSLVRKEHAAGLSNGERKMLHSAKQILLSELMLSQEWSYDEAEERLYAALG
ncbi:MAG: CarD family transcriptional regulator [Oscillospiraceae bacterium]|nr:CarD family transcriptional regulator [Oscillospiraceae bacterium]